MSDYALYREKYKNNPTRSYYLNRMNRYEKIRIKNRDHARHIYTFMSSKSLNYSVEDCGNNQYKITCDTCYNFNSNHHIITAHINPPNEIKFKCAECGDEKI